MGFIGRSWRGEEKLWKVFWLYGVLLGILLGIVWVVSVKALYGMEEVGFGRANLVFYGFSLIYSFWLFVSQWRCAFNVNWSIWGYIARILVVLGMIGLIFQVVTGVKPMMTMLEHGDDCRIVYSGLKSQSKETMASYVVQNRRKIDLCNAVLMDDAENARVSARLNELTKNISPAVQAPQPDMAAPLEPGFEKMCRDEMREHAVKNNIDPENYIAQNTIYLQQCVQYHIDSANQSLKSPATQ